METTTQTEEIVDGTDKAVDEVAPADAAITSGEYQELVALRMRENMIKAQGFDFHEYLGSIKKKIVEAEGLLVTVREEIKATVEEEKVQLLKSKAFDYQEAIKLLHNQISEVEKQFDVLRTDLTSATAGFVARFKEVIKQYNIDENEAITISDSEPHTINRIQPNNIAPSLPTANATTAGDTETAS